MQLNVVKTRNIWFTLSGSLVLASLVLMILSTIQIGTPFRLGLDFTGGTKLEYRFLNTAEKSSLVNTQDILKILAESGLENSTTTITKEENPLVIIRTKAISDDPALDILNSKLSE